MNTLDATVMLRALADGVDPETGEILPDHGVCNRPVVIRALFLAIAALECAPKTLTSTRRLPANAGKSWDSFEEEQLDREFSEGWSVKEIAKGHKRTPGAIRVRLVKIGRINERYQADVALAAIRMQREDAAKSDS